MDIDITYIPCERVAGSWNGFETGQIIVVEDNFRVHVILIINTWHLWHFIINVRNIDICIACILCHCIRLSNIYIYSFTIHIVKFYPSVNWKSRIGNIEISRYSSFHKFYKMYEQYDKTKNVITVVKIHYVNKLYEVCFELQWCYLIVNPFNLHYEWYYTCMT